MLTTIQRATCATRRFYCINANPFFREVLEIAPDKNVVSGQGEKVFDVVLGMIFRMSKGASFSFSESFSLRCFHLAMFAFIFHFYANVQLFMLAFFFTIHVQLRVPVSKFSCSAPFSSPCSMHLRRLSLTIYCACCSHRRSNSGTKKGASNSPLSLLSAARQARSKLVWGHSSGPELSSRWWRKIHKRPSVLDRVTYSDIRKHVRSPKSERSCSPYSVVSD